MMSICMQYTSLHISVNDPKGQYEQIESTFTKLMVQMYRSNKGDVNVPKLNDDMQNRVKDTPAIANFMLGLNLSVWTFQQIVFIMVGGIFTWRIMVAYEKFSKNMPNRIYQTKAQLNAENFDIMENIWAERKYKVICFSFDKKLKWDVYNEWNGQVNSIDTQLMIQSCENDYIKEEHDELLETRHRELETTKDIVDTLYDQIQALQEKCKCDCGKVTATKVHRQSIS